MSEELEEYQIVDYYAAPGLSSSEIGLFMQDPIAWHHRYVIRDWSLEPTAAMQFGTQVHRMIELGGPEKLGLVERPKEADFRLKRWKEWRDEQRLSGVEIVDTGALDSLRRIWDHLMANEFCRAVILEAEKEVEHHYVHEQAGQSKVKMDAVWNGNLVDWKTASQIDARRFAQDCVSRRYVERLAFYRWAFRDLYEVDPDCVYVVAIENSGSHRVVPYLIDDLWIDDAEARLIFSIEAMQNFDLAKFLDQCPTRLKQPYYAQLKFEEEK